MLILVSISTIVMAAQKFNDSAMLSISGARFACVLLAQRGAEEAQLALHDGFLECEISSGGRVRFRCPLKVCQVPSEEDDALWGDGVG
jgi:hypothetical protein